MKFPLCYQSLCWKQAKTKGVDSIWPCIKATWHICPQTPGHEQGVAALSIFTPNYVCKHQHRGSQEETFRRHLYRAWVPGCAWDQASASKTCEQTRPYMMHPKSHFGLIRDLYWLIISLMFRAFMLSFLTKLNCGIKESFLSKYVPRNLVSSTTRIGVLSNSSWWSK